MELSAVDSDYILSVTVSLTAIPYRLLGQYTRTHTYTHTKCKIKVKAINNWWISGFQFERASNITFDLLKLFFEPFSERRVFGCLDSKLSILYSRYNDIGKSIPLLISLISGENDINIGNFLLVLTHMIKI